jgi:hypothetical protein
MELIDAGSVGGVVTLSDVINSGAVRIGKTMVRLLNRGFPLRAALSIARSRSIVGDQYIVVGDGNLDVVQTESNMALLFVVESTETDDSGDPEFELTVKSYPSGEGGMGGFFRNRFDETRRCYLTSGEHGPYPMTKAELQTTLSMENVPMKIDGQFTWSTEIDVGEL